MITLLVMFLACNTEDAKETTTDDVQVEATDKAETSVETPAAATKVNANNKTSETLDELKKDLDDTIKTLDEVKVLVKDLDNKETDDNNDNAKDNQDNGDENANND